MWYRSPEILLGSRTHGPGIDLWSLGTILIELFTGRALFNGDSEIGTVFMIFRVLGNPPDETVSSWPWYSRRFPHWPRSDARDNLIRIVNDPDFPVDLALQLLQFEQKERIKAARVLEDDWLSEIQAAKVLAPDFESPGWEKVARLIRDIDEDKKEKKAEEVLKTIESQN